MSTPERKRARLDLIAAARVIGEKLDRALVDEHASTVVLSREDALLTVGLLAGATEALEREASRI